MSGKETGRHTGGGCNGSEQNNVESEGNCSGEKSCGERTKGNAFEEGKERREEEEIEV
jgi:hypothetical protein